METYYYELATLVLIAVSGLLIIFRKNYKRSLAFRIVTFVVIGIWGLILLALAYDVLQQTLYKAYRTLEWGCRKMIYYPY